MLLMILDLLLLKLNKLPKLLLSLPVLLITCIGGVTDTLTVMAVKLDAGAGFHGQPLERSRFGERWSWR